MSTILKALRRLEEEKAAPPDGRPLREEVASSGAFGPTRASPPAGRSRAWFSAIVAVLLGLVAGGGAFWWLNGRGPEAPEVVARADVAQPDAPAPRPAATLAARERRAALPPLPARPNADGPPDQAFASEVRVVERPEAKPRLADASPVQPSQREKPGQRRPFKQRSPEVAAMQALLEEVEAERAARLAANSAPREETPPEARRTREDRPEQLRRRPAEVPPTKQPGIEREPARVATAERRAAPEAPPPAPSRTAAKPPPRAAPAPAVKPKVAKASPPKPAPKPAAPPKPALTLPAGLHIERTLWHPIADRRQAWLRLEEGGASRKVVEGEVVRGLLVAEIKPSGIVFERDGQTLSHGLGSR